MKYELTSESIKVGSAVLYRIRALRNIEISLHDEPIKKGELGGFVQSEANLSQDGNCWIAGNAKAYGKSRVSGNALLAGEAEVSGRAIVTQNATVLDNAKARACCVIQGSAKLGSDAIAEGVAFVGGTRHVTKATVNNKDA